MMRLIQRSVQRQVICGPAGLSAGRAAIEHAEIDGNLSGAPRRIGVARIFERSADRAVLWRAARRPLEAPPIASHGRDSSFLLAKP